MIDRLSINTASEKEIRFFFESSLSAEDAISIHDMQCDGFIRWDEKEQTAHDVTDRKKVALRMILLRKEACNTNKHLASFIHLFLMNEHAH